MVIVRHRRLQHLSATLIPGIKYATWAGVCCVKRLHLGDGLDNQTLNPVGRRHHYL